MRTRWRAWAWRIGMAAWLGLVALQVAWAACGCPRFRSPVCTSTTATHRVDHLPYDGTWEGSCCDGGAKAVHVDHLPFSYQGRNYTVLPTDTTAPIGVVHAYVRFDGCR